MSGRDAYFRELHDAIRDHYLTPHGLDFVAELIPYARARHPGFEENFHVGNAWDWAPPRRYTFVRTSIECVPETIDGRERKVLMMRAC